MTSVLKLPAEYVGRSIDEFSREQLLDLLEATNEGGIRIAFSGKSNARRLARAVRPRVIRPLEKYCVGNAERRAANLVIEGDNLQAMATLYKERGQIDLILTDPPYNTGNDFRYNDRWDADPNDTGIGEFVRADDGARHTKWMRFMYPRLQMMKAMLKPGGVLAICIDHRELFRLGQMLDELFHEDNRLAIVNWQKTTSKNDARHVATTTEYVLVYAKDIAQAKTRLLGRSEKADARFANPDQDDDDWKQGDLTAPGDDNPPSMVYAIQSPFNGRLHYPPERRHWANEKRQMKAWLEDWGCEYEERDIGDDLKNWRKAWPDDLEFRAKRPKALVLKGTPVSGYDSDGWPVWRSKLDDKELERPTDHRAFKVAAAAASKRLKAGKWPTLYFGRDGQGKPVSKVYKSQVKAGSVPVTFWADDAAPVALDSLSWSKDLTGRSRDGVEELDAVVGKGHNFQTVKPLRLMKKILQIWGSPSGVVLDPFAGSGTTAQAVMELNVEASGQQRFILIEQGRPENGDSYARSLLSERLRRVVSGEWASGKRDPVSSGFTFLSLGKKVDANALLQMERDEMVDTVIASHFDSTRRRGDQRTRSANTVGGKLSEAA
jgi:adenine-specific DNA-methyltransferase